MHTMYRMRCRRIDLNLCFHCGRLYKDRFLLTFNEYGRKPPVFADAALVANAIIDADFKFDVASIYFNTFR